MPLNTLLMKYINRSTSYIFWNNTELIAKAVKDKYRYKREHAIGNVKMANGAGL